MAIVEKEEKTEKRKVRRKKTGVAAWERVRKKGLLRYLLVEGVKRNALFLAGMAAMLVFVLLLIGWGGFFWLHPLLSVGIIAGGVALGALRFMADAYLKWRRNEKEFLTWKSYEGGGDVLELGD